MAASLKKNSPLIVKSIFVKINLDGKMNIEASENNNKIVYDT